MSGKGRKLAERRWRNELAELVYVVVKRGERRRFKRNAARASRRAWRQWGAE